MQANNNNKGIGEKGEDVASRHLERMGFNILGRNIRYKTGEIDLVAKKGRELHFVEVKTRSSMFFQAPYESVTEEKKRRLKMAARLYLNDHRNNFKDNNEPPCIFSVISVDMSGATPEVEVFLDAFE